ncbi:MAG: tetratricopeptide repeat protein [Chlorobaculum sp.]|nr:tetratricopeptide repeat protein [Chlorobaculum sp.]
MKQPEETIRDDQRTWAESLESAARYFTDTVGGAFRFAVTNDELVQRRFNAELQQVLRGKETPVQIHDWSKASPPDMYPAEQLRRLKAAHPETKGIICVGLERAMWENPEMLTMLNFSREALAEVGVPLFFWISFKTLPLMSRFAIDLYNQRIGANLYFEHDTETADTDGSAMRYIAHETVQANRDLRPLEARLKLLEKQFDELKKIQSPEKLANDIVLELLKVYVKIPGMTRMVQSLIDEYGGFVDTQKPDYCKVLADAYWYYGELKKAEQFYSKALNQLSPLMAQNPEAWTQKTVAVQNNLALLFFYKNELEKAENGFCSALNFALEHIPNKSKRYLADIAGIINNLAMSQGKKGNYAEAEKNYQKALNIFRELVTDNSLEYWKELATTLNSLAWLQRDRNDFTEAQNNYEEALIICQKLVNSNPQVYIDDLAVLLNNLAALQSDQKEFTAAEKNFLEALSIRRELAESNPLMHFPDVAMILVNLGNIYQEGFNDRQKSLSCIEEALTIILPLLENIPQVHESFALAIKVIIKWGLDPKVFISNLNISHSNNPTNSASSPES